jgi:hypothetical protein
MHMSRAQKKRMNLLLPRELADDLYALVPPRQRGRVVAEAVAQELRRRRLLGAIEKSACAWGDAAHPDMKTASQIDRWIAGSRKRLGWPRSQSGE